jgi:hypothetical protein
VPPEVALGSGPAWLLLAAAMAGMAALLFLFGAGLTFFFDEWDFALLRHTGGVDTYLEPHNEHLTLLPVVTYKVWYAAVGLDVYTPYRLTAIALHLVCVALLFIVARRRVGNAVGLLAALSVLFLGSAWQDLLWPFQIGYLGSLAAGLGILLALDRHDRRGDLLAAALLVVSLAFSSVGIVLAVGVALEVLLRSDRLKRLWLLAAPLALYIAWYLAYSPESAARSSNLSMTPSFMIDMAAAGLAGLAGLAEPAWGAPIALLAGGAVGALLFRRAAITPRVAMLVAMPLAFWALTGLGRAHLSEPEASRYIYPSAVLLVLLAVELARGIKFRASGVALLAVAVTVAAALNLGVLMDGRDGLRDTSEFVRTELGALELARGTAPPDYRPDTVRMPQVSAGPYLVAVKKLGSPAFERSELLRAGEPERAAAARVLREAGFSCTRRQSRRLGDLCP